MNAFNPAYRISLGHIEDALIDERYIISGDVMRYLGKRMRAIGREEIVALSGNSGLGPREYGWVQPPHPHLSLYYWNDEKRILESLDPEKNGIDGGRPVFWDGKVFLDTRPEKRLSVLEKALVDVREEVGKWQKARDLQEVGATLTEYSNLLGNAKGKEILDSKHFQDMRSLLKRITLEEKKYLPGTAPYSLMLKIVGYSTDAKQDVILTLPFIAASLEKTYKKTEYENGPFLTINTIQE